MQDHRYAEVTAVQTVTPKQLLLIILAMLEADQPLMIWGQPGVGKSYIANVAARITEHIYHDIRLMVKERIDLMGLPIVTTDGRTSYATPDFLPPQDSPLKHMLNLEELPNAKQDMMTAIYELVLDRRIDQYKLPPGARIIACGNRLNDRGGVHRMLAPLASRFVHVELESNPEDWLDWAVDNDIDPDVLFFIKFHSESLNDFDPTREEHAFPCPRTWANLSKIKPHIENLDEHSQRALYRGAVGETAATAFTAFMSIKKELPHPKSVLLDPHGARVPENSSAKVAIASSLCRMADEFNMDAVCAYATRLGTEIGTYLVSQCIRMKPETADSPGYARWAARSQ